MNLKKNFFCCSLRDNEKIEELFSKRETMRWLRKRFKQLSFKHPDFKIKLSDKEILDLLYFSGYEGRFEFFKQVSEAGVLQVMGVEESSNFKSFKWGGTESSGIMCSIF